MFTVLLRPFRLQMDVTNEESVKKVAEIVRVDILVNKLAFELRIFVFVLTIYLQCGHKWTTC